MISSVIILCCRHIPHRGFNKFQIDNTNIAMKDILEKVFKRRKIKVRPGKLGLSKHLTKHFRDCQMQGILDTLSMIRLENVWKCLQNFTKFTKYLHTEEIMKVNKYILKCLQEDSFFMMSRQPEPWALIIHVKNIQMFFIEHYSFPCILLIYKV